MSSGSSIEGERRADGVTEASGLGEIETIILTRFSGARSHREWPSLPAGLKQGIQVVITGSDEIEAIDENRSKVSQMG